ncbi:putative cytochrome P450 9f2 [Xylocopa sonorina]|uniref:putative cytochrome P450 9f2 n=1 Tax=Xylocopa sonorina TaxID=1818115 RepID=UPI00403AE3DE
MLQELVTSFQDNDAERFVDSLVNLPENEREQELKELLSMYTNDVIVRCVYGVDVNTRKGLKNEFYVYGRIATSFTSLLMLLKLLLYRNASTLTKALGLNLMDLNVRKFFLEVVAEIVRDRDRTDVQQ